MNTKRKATAAVRHDSGRATNRIGDPFQDGGCDRGERVVRRHLDPQSVGDG